MAVESSRQATVASTIQKSEEILELLRAVLNPLEIRRTLPVSAFAVAMLRRAASDVEGAIEILKSGG